MDASDIFKMAILIFLVVAIIALIVKAAPAIIDMGYNFAGLKGKIL